MNDETIDSLIILRHNLFSSKQKLKNDVINTEVIKQIEDLAKTIEQILKAECSHEYVEDDIDIDPDRSQRVCYCNKCWSTFS
jgi:hypothetical protein